MNSHTEVRLRWPMVALVAIALVAGGISMFTGDVSSADFTLTFVGGTGRFADASGSADLIFLYDPLSGAYFRSIEGTIDY